MHNNALSRRTILLTASCAAVAGTMPGRLVAAPSFQDRNFDVFRKGRHIGTHTIRFVEMGGAWRVTHEVDLVVKIAFVTAFRYHQEAQDTWRDAVAQPYGIVYRADLQKTAGPPPDDLEAYACTLRFYAYRAALSPEQHAAVRACLEHAVARFPSYGTAWAMLSLLALDEDRFAFIPLKGDPIERALAAARRAVELDPDNARALQALMMALFFRGDVTEATSVGERALALSPSDSELLSEYGLRVAMAGEWQRGREFVEQALALNLGYAGYYHAVLALIAYMQRDLDRAEAEIRLANLEKFSLYHGIAAIIFAERGHIAEARAEAARFATIHPGFLANLDTELARRNLRPEDRARLVEGLAKAGLPILGQAVKRSGGLG